MPFYRSRDILGIKHQFSEYTVSTDDSTYIRLRLEVPPVTSDERVHLGNLKHGEVYEGLVAFYPVPAVTTLVCRVGGKRGKPIPLTPPQVINLYTESHLVEIYDLWWRQRDRFSS